MLRSNPFAIPHPCFVPPPGSANPVTYSQNQVAPKEEGRVGYWYIGMLAKGAPEEELGSAQTLEFTT